MWRKIGIIIILMILAFGFNVSYVKAAKNPYKQYFTLNGTNQRNCTWYAWQHVYDKTGISLPGWGNASTWYSSAKKAGFEVGQKPRNNSIIVTSFHNNGKNLGHVEYVEKVDGDKLYKWGTSDCVVDDYPPLVKCLSVIEDVPAGVDTMEEFFASQDARSECYKKYSIPRACEEYVSVYSGSDLLIGYIYLDSVPKTTTTKKTATTKKDMPTTMSTTVLDSNNVYLSNLTVEGIPFDFDKETKEYEFEVDNEVTTININGVSENTTSTIEGLGEHAINEGKNTFKIIVRAKDGYSNVYSININRKAKETTTVITTRNDLSNEKIKEQDNKDNYKMIIFIALGCLIALGIIVGLLKRKRS